MVASCSGTADDAGRQPGCHFCRDRYGQRLSLPAVQILDAGHQGGWILYQPIIHHGPQTRIPKQAELSVSKLVVAECPPPETAKSGKDMYPSIQHARLWEDMTAGNKVTVAAH